MVPWREKDSASNEFCCARQASVTCGAARTRCLSAELFGHGTSSRPSQRQSSRPLGDMNAGQRSVRQLASKSGMSTTRAIGFALLIPPSPQPRTPSASRAARPSPGGTSPALPPPCRSRPSTHPRSRPYLKLQVRSRHTRSAPESFSRDRPSSPATFTHSRKHSSFINAASMSAKPTHSPDTSTTRRVVLPKSNGSASRSNV